MTHPAEEARSFIMEALEAVQSNDARSLDLERLAQSLAKAQGQLFAASKKPVEDQECVLDIKKSMEFLAQALQQLQEVREGGQAIEVASRCIARSLGKLYPIIEKSKAKEAEQKAAAPSAASAAGTAAAPSAKDLAAKTIQMNLDETLKMDGDTQFYSGFSENIDEGGIFVATFDTKAINSKILVTFSLPGGRKITAKGIVRWVREYNHLEPDMAPGMGIRFTQLHPDDAKSISEYLKQRAPLFYDDSM